MELIKKKSWDELEKMLMKGLENFVISNFSKIKRIDKLEEALEYDFYIKENKLLIKKGYAKLDIINHKYVVKDYNVEKIAIYRGWDGD